MIEALCDSAARTSDEGPSADAVEVLGERIALLAAQISAATFELLTMLREFDERGGWSCGFRSCAHWLNWRVGLDLGAAREKVRVARALAALPRLSESMRRGELSYAKVRALTRIATPANEVELLTFARAGTAAHIERLVREMRRVDRTEANEQERRRHERAATCVPISMRTEWSSSRPRCRKRRERLCCAPSRQESSRCMAGRAERKVAIRLVATSRPPSSAAPTRWALSPRAPSPAAWIPARAATATRSSFTDADALALDGDGSATLADGAHVSAETCRRLACDAALITMRHAADGRVLDVGRRTRAISPALRRALERRDRGCRFPGCGLRLCDAHHVEHWADGGATRLPQNATIRAAERLP